MCTLLAFFASTSCTAPHPQPRPLAYYTIIFYLADSLPLPSAQPHIRSQGHVTISQLVTEHDLIGRSEAFEAAIAGGDRQTLHSYCENKVSA